MGQSNAENASEGQPELFDEGIVLHKLRRKYFRSVEIPVLIDFDQLGENFQKGVQKINIVKKTP